MQSYGESLLEEILPQLPIEEIAKDARQLQEEEAQTQPTDFLAQTGGAVCGHLAFSEQDITTLSDADKRPIIYVAETFGLNETPLLNKIDGALVLDKAAAHARALFAQYGKTALFEPDAAALSITTKADGTKELSHINTQTPYPLKAGALVSIGSRKLYPEQLPIITDETRVHQIHYLAQDAAAYAKDHNFSVQLNTESPDIIRKIGRDAHSVGLVRTEQLFVNDGDEGAEVLTRCLSEHPVAEETLSAFKAAQKTQLAAILQATRRDAGLWGGATIRLLDAKPGELLGRTDDEDKRGVQFAKDRPEIYQAQIKALVEAALETGWQKPLKILVPFVESAQEMGTVKNMIDAVLQEKDASGLKYQLGAMIESKQGAENIATIAPVADFISFGTNDLTASVLSLARDDRKAALQWAEDNHVENDPFRVLCPPVLEVMEQAIHTVKEADPYKEIRVCGEQVSGNYQSIQACHNIGATAISVQPEQFDISTLFAAKAVVAAQPEKSLSGFGVEDDLSYDNDNIPGTCTIARDMSTHKNPRRHVRGK